jgi:predicted nuclease of predicted toxin-antitoxin system
VVVVTKDDDFAKLLGQHGPPPQVVWLRSGNVTNQNFAATCSTPDPRRDLSSIRLR